jgi:hypothetical protein
LKKKLINWKERRKVSRKEDDQIIHRMKRIELSLLSLVIILILFILYNFIIFTQKDKTSPLWKSQGQNSTFIHQDEGVLLYAQGYDENEIDKAILSTNETGRWENKTFYKPKFTKAEEGWTWCSFVWENSSVQPNTTVTWFIWLEDSSGNWNKTDLMSFTIIPITECRVAIDLSPRLHEGVRFQIDPGKTVDGLGNNGTGPTEYWVDVFVTNCIPNTVDLYIKADPMVFDTYTIPLSNFKVRYSITDSTVSGKPLRSLTTNYLDNKIGTNLQNRTRVYLKFQLSVPAGQRAGEYVNTIHVKGTKSDIYP